MRRRLRKKLHRKYVTLVCAWAVTFDDDLRQRLLHSQPRVSFAIGCDCSPGMQRLKGVQGLRYCVAMTRKLTPATAAVVYWSEEFPSVRDEAIIFSASDLGLTQSPTCFG